MAQLTIGGRKIAVARPADLADRVLALTGLSVGELRERLAAPQPTTLSAAIAAIATASSAPNRAELGELVAEGDMMAIAAGVLPYLKEESASVGE